MVVSTEDTRGAFWKPSECEFATNDSFRREVCVCWVWVRDVEWVLVCLPYMCILQVVNLVSTCLTTESQFLMTNLDY